MELVHAEIYCPVTMCGSLVRYGDRTSTLGLLISVDSKLYGLTVDHLFCDQKAKREEILPKVSDILLDHGETKDDQENEENLEDYWVDDVIYHAMDYDEDTTELRGPETQRPPEVDANAGNDFMQHLSEPIVGHKIDAIHELDPSNPYLDWALIEFDDGYFKRPNAFYSKDGRKHLKFFNRASPPPSPNDNEIQVFMISGPGKTRKGVLVNSGAYIGGDPGQILCKAWNVILCDPIGKW
jgi:hypothetical protein